MELLHNRGQLLDIMRQISSNARLDQLDEDLVIAGLVKAISNNTSGDSSGGCGSSSSSNSSGGGCGSSSEQLSIVTYKGLLRFPDSYQPGKPCAACLLEDGRSVLAGVSDLDFVVDESRTVLDSLLQHLPPGTPVLPYEEALAVVIYTYDLGVNSTTQDGSDNFYAVLNPLLRDRNQTVMLRLKPYLAYLMRGLSSLPPLEGTCYRGVPPDNLEVVARNYTEGTDIYWSAFTSTTLDIDRTKEFAQAPGGVIFRLKVLTGRSVVCYSAFLLEQEILLGPNTSCHVVQAATLEDDGFYYYVTINERKSKFIL